MKQHEKQEAVAEDAKAVGQAVADVLSSFPPQKLDMVKDDGSKEKGISEAKANEPTKENLRGNGLEEKLDNLQNLIEKQLSQQENKPQPEEVRTTESGKEKKVQSV